MSDPTDPGGGQEFISLVIRLSLVQSGAEDGLDVTASGEVERSKDPH